MNAQTLREVLFMQQRSRKGIGFSLGMRTKVIISSLQFQTHYREVASIYHSAAKLQPDKQRIRRNRLSGFGFIRKSLVSRIILHSTAKSC